MKHVLETTGPPMSLTLTIHRKKKYIYVMHLVVLMTMKDVLLGYLRRMLAYFPSFQVIIFYLSICTYGGEEGKQSLSRIDAASLDGSNRKTLITFNNGERLGDVFCTNGESLICSLTTLEQLPDTLESTFTLCMIDLNTGERVDLYVEDTTDGIQPEFLGVTETG